MMSENNFRLGIYVTGFILGFVLMGFQMLSSRYMNPWFGSGIYTWAAIISVTLFALVIGYFWGGRLVDRRPSAALLGWLVALAGLSMAVIPLLFDPMVLLVIDGFGDGPTGVTAAAFGMLIVPLTLIACYSPFAVRLLLMSTQTSGRQTGAVYGINTCGNILGTLGTAFWLIPTVGSREITYWFAAIVVACGVGLIWLGRARKAAE
ncbi:MAG: fused MFS/spermidine synthase [Paracoccaceae bacterium]